MKAVATSARNFAFCAKLAIDEYRYIVATLTDCEQPKLPAEETSQLTSKMLLRKAAGVTGATSGTGQATAFAFARAGAHVMVTGRWVEEGEALAAAVRAADTKAPHRAESGFLAGDVSKEADAMRMVKGAVALAKLTDSDFCAAFNNAGIEGLARALETEQTLDNYNTTFVSNVLGVLLSMTHEVRAMLAQTSTGVGQAGVIISNASIAGSIEMAGMSVYVASKHAVMGLTNSAALAVARQHIRTDTVSPGAIETPMLDRFATTLEPSMREQMAAVHPVGRGGIPEDVAQAVVWLCSPSSAFVTGADILVDEGYAAQ